LDALDLPPAKYRTEVTENDLFIGFCSIYLGSCVGPNATGPTDIRGDPKQSQFDAESSAAAYMISFLERTKKFEVVDFNYDSLNMLREKHDNLLHHRWKYDSVVSDAYMSWEHFADSLQAIINEQYDLAKTQFCTNEYSSELTTLVACASELEQAL